MGDKLKNFGVPLMKSICDLLCLNRRPPSGKLASKGFLFNLLLEFFSHPDEKYVNTAPMDAASPAKKKRKANEDDQDKGENSDDYDSTEEKEPKPTKPKLKKWVKAYVACFSMDKATAKHALQTASDKFGVDLSAEKPYIMDLLKKEVQSNV